MVGEYLGGFFNQHITYEKKETIVFYGVCKKSTFVDDVITFENAAKAVGKLGLEFVKYQVFKGDEQEIQKQVEKIIDQCVYESLESIGEGFVLYFEEDGRNKHITKLKSIDYIIERAFREFSSKVF